MGEANTVKQVYFIGAWRTQQVTDQLLRQISNHIASKKKVVTNLQVTSQGLILNLLDANGKVTRQDKIALENIVDLIDNKYSTTCTLAIVRDKQQKVYTVFVFLCRSDKDAAELIHVFKTTKRQLSGEGFNTNLTPKGKNWTLRQKSAKVDGSTVKVNHVANGDVKNIKSEKQNGGVTIIHTNERHDSFSRLSERSHGTEVQEELKHLADEVRDIKSLLVGSKGRANFEKHYRYRLVEMPVTEEVPTHKVEYVYEDVKPAQHIEYIKDEVDHQPVQMKRETLYVKNGNYLRNQDAQRVVTVSGGVGRLLRSKRRSKTGGQVIVAPAPQPQAIYTKQVYDYGNPTFQQHVRVQSPPPRPVKYFSKSFRPMMAPRSRSHHAISHGSDIVHKNIEDVYKSRSLRRRIYLPQAVPINNTTEYVNSQVVEEHRNQQFRQPTIANGVRQQNDAVHVKYTPEVRTYYENTQANADEVSNSSQVSTNVNISINDNLDDKMRQIESSMNLKQQESSDNLIVVKSRQEVSRNEYNNSHRNEDDDSEVIRENVYHVKARIVDDFDEVTANADDNIVVIGSDRSKRYKKKDLTGHKNDAHIIRNENITVFSSREDDHGLFGAYAKRPDLNGKREDITADKAYRYHDGEDDEDADHLPRQENGTEVNGVTEEKRVRYNDTVEHIPDQEHDSERLIGTYKENKFQNVVIVDDSDMENEDEDDINFDMNKIDKDKSDDEESYHLDIDALRAYTTDPNIEIVDNNSNTTKLKSKVDAVKHAFTENEIREITTRAEDTVLF